MKEAQCDLPRVVAYAHQQIATTAVNSFREQYLTADQAPAPGLQCACPDELRAVLVTKWQQKQPVLDTEQIQALELLHERRSDAVQDSQG